MTRLPIVALAVPHTNGTPCNDHIGELGRIVFEAIEKNGGKCITFGTPVVSDGISMGTDGMSYSLQSRDLIADSIETVMSAQWYDANISLPGCDKNMPGCLIAMGRLNRPAIMVYGGTIKPGHYHEQTLDIVSAFQSYGQYINQLITDEEREEIVKLSCPGAGACGGMYTANTMASAPALASSAPTRCRLLAESSPANSIACGYGAGAWPPGQTAARNRGGRGRNLFVSS